MDQTGLENLITRRDQVAAKVAQMVSMPEDQRPQKLSELKTWLHDLRMLQRLVEQMDKLIARATDKPQVGLPDLTPDLDPNTGDVITVARVRKGRRAEIRVTVKPWEGRRVVDVRLWCNVDGQGDEMKPSRKGIAFDASKLGDVIDALIQAKQHV